MLSYMFAKKHGIDTMVETSLAWLLFLSYSLYSVWSYDNTVREQIDEKIDVYVGTQLFLSLPQQVFLD